MLILLVLGLVDLYEEMLKQRLEKIHINTLHYMGLISQNFIVFPYLSLNILIEVHNVIFSSLVKPSSDPIIINITISIIVAIIENENILKFGQQ